MRIAIVTESYFPQVTGVSNSVRHVVDRLVRTGHQTLLVAPGPGPAASSGLPGDVPVVRTRSASLPGYRSFPLGLPDRQVLRALADFEPDVVHLASPISLGACGLRAARQLGVPVVAVYQTDVGGFARQYGVPAGRLLDGWTARLHRQCDRTLVPSSASRAQLMRLGVPDLHLWGRGVDTSLFDPARRSQVLHDQWAADADRVVVGYVGRLAAEKNVRRLVEVSRVPGVDLVVVGDGPERGWLERHLPHATFTGMLRGEELAEAFASVDVFVHPGESETFCQTVQEAQASGVAVVAAGAGGPVDLVRHGVTGLLFDPSDPRSLRRAVASVVGDVSLRRSLAEAGQRAVQDRTWDRLVDDLVADHYRPVLRPSTVAVPRRVA
jgi:phosphatidylinositol alpha 1,6-mannosyltransferase